MCLLLSLIEGFTPLSPQASRGKISLQVQTVPDQEPQNKSQKGRRHVLIEGLAGLFVVVPTVANAGIDPSALRSLPVEGDASGSSTRLRQLEAVNKPESDTVDKPWEELSSGVSYREYREGKGEAGM